MGNNIGSTQLGFAERSNIPRALSISNIPSTQIQRRWGSPSSQRVAVRASSEINIHTRSLRQVHNSLEHYKGELVDAYGDSYEDIYRDNIEQADIGILYVREDSEIQQTIKRSLQEFCRNIRIISPRPGFNIYREWERMFHICSTIIIIFSKNFSKNAGMRHLRANILMTIEYLYVYQHDNFEDDDDYWKPNLIDCTYQRRHVSLEDWSKILVCKMQNNGFFIARYEREEKKAKQQLELVEHENTYSEGEDLSACQSETLAIDYTPIQRSSAIMCSALPATSPMTTPVKSLAMNCLHLTALMV